MQKSKRAAEKMPAKLPWTKPEIRKIPVTDELLALFEQRGPVRLVVDRIGEV